jgi:hypothetical protein
MLLTACLLYGLVWAANVYLIQTKFRAFLEDSIASETSTKVSIEKLQLHLLKGFSMKNLEIVSPQDNKVIFSARDINFTFLILPLFYKKTVVIPTLYIHKPALAITRDKNARLNITSLVKGKPTRGVQKKKSQFSFVIYKVFVRNGSFEVRDAATNISLTCEDTHINATVNPGKIHFAVQSLIRNARVKALGDYLFKDNAIDSEIKIDTIDFARINDILSRFNNALLVKKAAGECALNVHVAFDKILSLSGDITMRDADLAYNNVTMGGNAVWHVRYMRDLHDTKKNPDFKSTLDLRDAYVQGIASTSLSKINGGVSLDNDMVSAQDVHAQFLDTDARISFQAKKGARTDFTASLATTVDVAKLGALTLEPVKKFFSTFSASGDAKIDLTVSGSYPFTSVPQYRAEVYLDKAKVALKESRFACEDIAARLRIDNNAISSDRIDFACMSTPYQIHDFLIDNKARTLSCAFDSQSLEGHVKISQKNNLLNIDEITAKMAQGNSSARMNGQVQDYNTRDAQLILYTDCTLDLEDLPRLAALIGQQWGKDVPAKGILTASLFTSGPMKDIRAQEIGVKASSQSLTLSTYTITDLRAYLQGANGVLTSKNIDFNAYGGTGNVTLQAKTLEDPPSWKANVVLRGIQIEQYCAQTQQNKNIKGALDADMQLEGAGFDKNNVHGTSFLKITDGYLFEVPVLSNLMYFLKISSKEDLVFKEASGNLSLKDAKIKTQDFTLDSERLTLAVEGTVDFNGTLEGTVRTSISRLLFGESTAKALHILTDRLDTIMGTVKVTGTLQNPQFSYAPVPTREAISKGIDLLKSITGKSSSE